MTSLFVTRIQSPHERYVHLRDSPKFEERKLVCERLWTRFQPFADSYFPDKFAMHPHQRFWEMYLGSKLLEAGHDLVPKRGEFGPDLCLRIDNRTIWVEATTTDEGTGPDAVPLVSAHSGYDPIPDDRIILRFTNSISEKFDKLAKYQQGGLVAPNDGYVIAINAGDLDMTLFEFDFPLPLIIKSVYPVGEQYIQIDRSSGAVVGDGFRNRYRIRKKSGSEVPTTAFLDRQFSGISGIIYSQAAFWDRPGEKEKELLFVHNLLADIPCPRGWLKRGIECWVAKDQLHLSPSSDFA